LNWQELYYCIIIKEKKISYSNKPRLKKPKRRATRKKKPFVDNEVPWKVMWLLSHIGSEINLFLLQLC
jgi:hypothetical protein